MQIKIKKLNPEAKLPSYAHPGDAGMDIFSLEEINLKPGQRVKVSTGWAIEIPEGFVGLVWDKSGISTGSGIKTLAGVVDSGYRGEVKIGLINLSSEEYYINRFDKVAQMLIQPIESPEIVEILNLTETVRGDNGFGSTGRQ